MMNAKIGLFFLIAVAMVSFSVTKNSDNLGVENINFNRNPIGNEFVMPHNGRAELEMIDMINNLRKKKGLKTLKYDQKLTQAARYHAADMAIENYFEHHTHNLKDNMLQDELGTFERIGKFYKGIGYPNSENCAAGNTGVKDTFLQWLHSPGHYANMLNSSSTHIGIGYYYNENSYYSSYWVMDTASE
jgi:uncharacterized protein YkwD